MNLGCAHQRIPSGTAQKDSKGDLRQPWKCVKCGKRGRWKIQGQGSGKREANRRLSGMGLSRHDNDADQREAQRKVEAYLQHARESACVVTRLRSGEWIQLDHKSPAFEVRVEPAHIKSRGAWGADFGNVIPLAHHLHDELHRVGEAAFNRKYGVNVSALAADFLIRYERDVLGIFGL